MLIHKGERFQAGRGLGALFAGMLRGLKPVMSMGLSAGKKFLASDLAKNIKATALDVGKTAVKNIATDLLEGKDLSESLNKELELAKAKVASKIRGSGRSRKRKHRDDSATLGSLISKQKKYNLLN